MAVFIYLFRLRSLRFKDKVSSEVDVSLDTLSDFLRLLFINLFIFKYTLSKVRFILLVKYKRYKVAY